MKKVISILICVLIVMSTMCIIATASSATTNKYTYTIDDTNYTVEFEDNNLTSEEQEILARRILGLESSDVQTCGLGCTLFGHDYKYTTSVTQHKVRDSAPRCKVCIYDVTYCEDCSYTDETLTSTSYQNCCS